MSQPIAGYNGTLHKAITLLDIQLTGRTDPEYQTLQWGIRNGFANSKHELDPAIRKYWEVIYPNRLSMFEDVVLLDRRLVIPPVFEEVCHSQHACHTSRVHRNDISSSEVCLLASFGT